MRSYIEETDFFKGNDPEAIAQKYGTPVYVYNEENIREHMRAVANVITKYPYRANYSMKANSNLSILKMALEEGLNADAMSEGEMRLLMKAGFPADRIFFVPNNVDRSELQFAIDNDIWTAWISWICSDSLIPVENVAYVSIPVLVRVTMRKW